MEKSESIKKLLSELQLEKNRWIIQDHWQADLYAIGIACEGTPAHLVYVNTFGKPDGLYYYECETPKGKEDEDYVVFDRGDNVNFDELSIIIKNHLGKECK